MYKALSLACLLACMTAGAHAASGDFLADWPTHGMSDSGYEYGVEGLYQYDFNGFSGDARNSAGEPSFRDANTWRRKELDAYIETPFGFKLRAGYDFQNAWTDNYLQLDSGNAGVFRIGQFKTQVGWEENESAGALTFLERSLPATTVYEGRRLGLAWSYDKVPRWLFSAAGYSGGDLNGDHDGHGYSGRIVYAPLQRDTDVWHVGVAASREWPDADTASFGSPPEAGLTQMPLVTTATLDDVGAIDRAGLEMGWKHGPLYAQGEYLRLRAHRHAGQGDFIGTGFYVTGAWLLTGESRVYEDSYFVNVEPSHACGALELAARYSEVDLDDGSVQGGAAHNWTIGVNWYLGEHIKLQADYVWAHAGHRSAGDYVLPVDPRILEIRTQVYF